MLWIHSLKVAQMLRSAASLHTNQSQSYLNQIVFEEKKISKAKQLISFKIKNNNVYNVLTWSPLHPLGVTSRRMENICPNKGPVQILKEMWASKFIRRTLFPNEKNIYIQIGSCHKSER